MSPSRKGLRLLCDENIPIKVVESLRSIGFNVSTPPAGLDDVMVAELSRRDNRILITFDKHFGNTLLFPPEKYMGIVFIRIRPPLIKTVLDSLINLFKLVKSADFKGKLFVLSIEGFRIFPRNKN
jgi:predicted nuclease of predicted toxin-antitoxin system